jgi:putative spermidine/putrescine transport system ATP-binding protein
VGGSNRLEGEFDGETLRLPGGALIPASCLAQSASGRAIPAKGTVAAFFRPDQARLADPAPDRMRGEVVTAHFLGEKTRLVVQIDEAHLIKLELPSAASAAPGERIGIALPEESVMVFGEEECA